MRCLILGGTGMVGHQLLLSWQDRHDVRVTLRDDLSAYRKWGIFHERNSLPGIDVRDLDQVRHALRTFQPEAVVNAVGLIKQRRDGQERLPNLEINAVFPHQLRQLCEEAGARLVHLSTDCVFSGLRGQYTEVDRCDAEDVYGMAKYLGEVAASPALTLRLSVIGLELSQKQSLVEWFLAQRGEIRGFTRAIYTGVTTLELARILEHVLVRHRDLTGLWQVASAPINKCDLLSRLSRLLGRTDVRIRPDTTFQCDRSLVGSKFAKRTGYHVADWDRMLAELALQIQQRERCHVAA
jgi:dTDP-4-dehydrorhamnose reductase